MRKRHSHVDTCGSNWRKQLPARSKARHTSQKRGTVGFLNPAAHAECHPGAFQWAVWLQMPQMPEAGISLTWQVHSLHMHIRQCSAMMLQQQYLGYAIAWLVGSQAPAPFVNLDKTGSYKHISRHSHCN
jgi:hypothetical protein